MVETLFVLLLNLPFGLLIAALLVEAFVLWKNEREAEPAVLWLLFCSVCASGLVVLMTLALFFWKGDPSRLHDGFWGLAAGAAGALAWLFKRQGRNRNLLYLKERFFGENPLEPPKAKPGQFFWILGWRTFAAATLVAALGSILRVKPGMRLSELAGPVGTEAATPAKPAEPVLVSLPPEKAPDPFSAAPEGTAPLAPEEYKGPAGTQPVADPTKAELPPAEASAMAAALAAAQQQAGTPAAGTPAAPEATAPGATPGAPMPVTTPAAVPVVAPAAEPARPVSRNSAYFSKIRPIFAKACVKCHGAEKQKGDLALHNPDAIRAGINGKPAIIPGNPEKSRVYACIVLPPDDPDFMPQKGQPLGMSDKKALFDWIKSGADLGDGVSIPSGQGGVFVVDTIASGLPDPDAAVLEALQRDHVNVRHLSQNKRVLELDFSHSDRANGDLKLAELAPVALNIYSLDLSRTRVKDADLAALSGMRNLSRLILSRTQITDAGLAHLKANATLEEINLYSTEVTDAGVAQLNGLRSLKKVYLWQSKATPAGAQALEQAVPGVVVSLGN